MQPLLLVRMGSYTRLVTGEEVSVKCELLGGAEDQFPVPMALPVQWFEALPTKLPDQWDSVVWLQARASKRQQGRSRVWVAGRSRAWNSDSRRRVG